MFNEIGILNWNKIGTLKQFYKIKTLKLTLFYASKTLKFSCKAGLCKERKPKPEMNNTGRFDRFGFHSLERPP